MTFHKVKASQLRIGDKIKSINTIYRITELEHTASEARVLLCHIRYGTQTYLAIDNHEKVKVID